MTPTNPGTGRVCIDFDNTLCEWGDIHDTNLNFLPGAIEALLSLNARFEVWILTSRVSPHWYAESEYARTSSIAAQKEVVATIIFNETGLLVPHDRITSEKIRADWYIDDRAVRFRGDWQAALAEVMGE